MFFRKRPASIRNIMFLTKCERYGVILTEEQMNTVIKHATASECSEVGGVLVGRYSRDLRLATVSEVLLLNNQKKNDKGHYFVRDGSYLSKLLEKLWGRTNGVEYYLGEWHSHPLSSPMLSSIDNQTMLSIAHDPEEECYAPILLIVGGQCNTKEGIKIFVFPRNEKYLEMDLVG